MFGRKFTDDNYDDIKRYEEYKRREAEAVTKGVGNFLVKGILYWSLFLLTAGLVGVFLMNIFKVSEGLSFLCAVIASFAIFKIKYVKERPFKSLIIVCFLYFLLFVMAGDIKV